MKYRVRFVMLLAWITATACLLPWPVTAQDSTTDQTTRQILAELRSLRAAVENMRADIQQLKTSLPARPAAEAPPATQSLTNVVFDLAGRTFLGQPQAKLTMVEFSDYQCPFCRNFESNTFGRIQQQYIATGKLKYYMFSFPLKGHQFAEIAARAALCASGQGKFWEMHERLFAERDLTRDNFIRMARDLHLDSEGFQSCLDMGAYDNEIKRDVAEGEKAGVHAIPCFLLGVTNPEGDQTQMSQLIMGAKPFEEFSEVLDRLLSAQTP